MPNGFLNISHNFAGETNFIICEWVKSTAQGTPVIGHVTGTGLGAQNDTDVTEVFYPAPHVNQQLQVINISEEWHLVRFWRSADGSSKDVLLLELAGNSRTGALFPIQRYEYVVGRGDGEVGIWADPSQDDVGIRDTRLFEKAYWIEERGTASLLEAEWTDRSDEGGGFDFVDPFKVMNEGGVYVVYVINKVTQSGDDSGLIISNDGVYILDSDQVYNPVTMGNRTIIADFLSDLGVLTFGDLAVAPDSRFKLQTHAGNQRNVTLQLDAGDTVKFRKEDVNAIILGEGEEIEILIRDNVMYVLSHVTNHFRLGQVIWSYKEMMNGLKAEGELLVLADYPRVAELINGLEASSVVSEVVWQTSVVQADGQTTYPNKGKWMSDGINFRTPDLRNQMFKSMPVLDGTGIPGSYEHDAIKSHIHYLRGGFTYGGYDGGSNTFWRIRNNTDPFNILDDPMDEQGELDNLVKNTQLYPIICI